MIMKGKDKKDVCLISTIHDDKMAPTRIWGQDREIPKVVIDYNSGMEGVDISDACWTNYCSTRKDKKKKILLLHVHPLLGNVLVNKFPRGQILGKRSIARLRNSRGKCVFHVRGDVTTVDSDHVICVFCRSDRCTNRLAR
jgi:hypothetical protein